MKKRLMIFAIILLIFCLGLFSIYHIRKSNRYLYKIAYFDKSIPSYKYDIEIFNNKVEYIRTNFCSTENCKESTNDKVTLKYTKANIQKIKDYLEKRYDSKKIVIKEYEDNYDLSEVIESIVFGEKFFELAIEDYMYKIEYLLSDDTTYVIYLKDDDAIMVKKVSINDDYDITDIRTYNLGFSNNKMNIITNYIKKETVSQNVDVIYKTVLRKDERTIYDSIMKNDESLLNDYKSIDLLYTITYSGLNCLTPTLYLYSDKTYEYYYTFASSGSKIKPLTGSYNYDIEKLISNIDDSLENILSTYYIKTKDNVYVVNDNNEEMNDFLND